MAGRALARRYTGWAGNLHDGPQTAVRPGRRPDDVAAVAAHAAGIGVAGALSFANRRPHCALCRAGNPRSSPRARARPSHGHGCSRGAGRRTAPPSAADGGQLFDFRPVLRNRSADGLRARVLCPHAGDECPARMGAWRFSRTRRGEHRHGHVPVSPTLVATGLALLGTAASVAGNEARYPARPAQTHP